MATITLLVIASSHPLIDIVTRHPQYKGSVALFY
jgi:hypothetical protein